MPYEHPYSDVYSPSPSNGELGVSSGLTQLSFSLDHPLGELMDYVVTCDPDIIGGSATGTNVGDGVETVPVSGLISSQKYARQVDVTDDTGRLTSKTYVFTTGPYTSNSAPTQGPPSLAGVSLLDDLVASPTGTSDVDGDDVTNIYSWTEGGVPYANLILPFDTMTDPDLAFSGFAYTNDYSGEGNDGNVFGA